jgi:uncharacterized protein YuzE
MEKKLNIYFDKEADFLEVMFEIADGYFVETESDSVMEKIGVDGKILGFSIQNVSKLSNIPLSVNLNAA